MNNRICWTEKRKNMIDLMDKWLKKIRRLRFLRVLLLVILLLGLLASCVIVPMYGCLLGIVMILFSGMVILFASWVNDLVCLSKDILVELRERMEYCVSEEEYEEIMNDFRRCVEMRSRYGVRTIVFGRVRLKMIMPSALTLYVMAADLLVIIICFVRVISP